jgi:hypothetical protein
MDNDPKPDIEPTIFIQELIHTILDQRTSIGVDPNAMCSLDLRYNNVYIGGLLSDTNISERIMMETKCPLTTMNYMNPIGNDFSDSDGLYKEHAKSFDTSQKAKVSHIANIGVATLLTPIDNNGTVVTA